ncbi:MAG: histidinol dehydrogenase, partial [Longimicrobiales bacterium]|nr:histidinol dehydrogenase [Longimicrobiales bacterium]
LSDEELAPLLRREPMAGEGVVERVAGIIADVRGRGDDALLEMARRFDGVELNAVEVPRESWDDAVGSLDPSVRKALERAADNIRRFHTAQLPDDVTLEVEPGVVITRTWAPLARVGVYAPGGTAAYPSSVLMGVVPARAAGVDEVVVCSPPGPSGQPPSAVLAACAIAGADRLFALGGAGAVAAMAYGTATVPVVDAIVGPGNRWVTEAKRQVAGNLVIDSPAGPSEVLVLVDDTADPLLAAHEILAQAEHDPDASCVLVSTSPETARATEEALATLLRNAPRKEIALQALSAEGGILVADSMADARAFTDRYAPEHLSIMARDAAELARRLRHAGTTFVGPWASVAFGDYITGANHVLPTAGRARSFSGLSTAHFVRSFTIQEITRQGATSLADDVATLADAEGLPGHAAAARARSEADAAGSETPASPSQATSGKPAREDA